MFPGSEDFVLAESSRPHRARRWLAVLATLAVVAALGGAGWIWGRDQLTALATPRCQATATGESVTFSPEQMHHAATITAIAMKRGLPARAATIALATAIQESKLRNITYGDRDSLGLFQQRPSQGWGTQDELLDPVFATNAFYDALVKVDGYETMEITKIAQEVQKSAYPEAYADHELEGRLLASAISGHSPGGLGCRLDDPEGRTDTKALQEALQTEVGVAGSAEGDTLVVTADSELVAWRVGAWAVAQAKAHAITSVSVGTHTWTRTRDASGWEWSSAGDGSGDATRVALTLTP
ncbi:hypothetical protein [Janibacter sp. G1551]|uniref:hypothetical protein n=1 Tax=Janibacter sp. G1551 TaxID=3420440 RepID=UPI003D090851